VEKAADGVVTRAFKLEKAVSKYVQREIRKPTNADQ